MAFKAVALDTGTTLVYTCLDGETRAAIPLAGCAVTLVWAGADGAMQRRAMDIGSPATAGKASYTFQAGELSAPEMIFEVQIADGDGTVLTSLDPFTLPVRARIPANATVALAGAAASGGAGAL